jgi:hypothetical protein
MISSISNIMQITSIKILKPCVPRCYKKIYHVSFVINSNLWMCSKHAILDRLCSIELPVISLLQ